MAYDFNAADMFEIAIRIEENGASFYRHAAEKQSDEKNRHFLMKLADMEISHKQIFERMKQTITSAQTASTIFDPLGESGQYLAAMADAHGGEGSPVAAERLTGDESIQEIVDIAIGLEKESILFYLGLRDLVPANLGQEKLDRIIAEERRHIAQLNGHRQKIQNGPKS